MAFRVFASGTGDFGFEDTHTELGDYYEMADYIERLNLHPHGLSDVLIDEGARAASATSPLQHGLNAIGRLSSFETLHRDYSLLTAHFHAIDFTLQASETSSWYDPFPDATGGCHETIGDDHGFRWFMDLITPALDAGNLNTWGGLDALAAVFRAFEHHGGRTRGQTMLLVQMTRD